MQTFTRGVGLDGPQVDITDFYASPGARLLYRSKETELRLIRLQQKYFTHPTSAALQTATLNAP